MAAFFAQLILNAGVWEGYEHIKVARSMVLQGATIESRSVVQRGLSAFEKCLANQDLAQYQGISEIISALEGFYQRFKDVYEGQDSEGFLNNYFPLENFVSYLYAHIENYQELLPETPTRIWFINKVIESYGFNRYLEIGCRDDACFSKINAEFKIGVDPEQGGTHRMTSDQYFADNKESFDLIFIDGLHEAWQVVRDIDNALRSLSPKGVIVMHDCNPLFEIRQIVPMTSSTWNGDVWKAYVSCRINPNIDMAVGNFDHGVGVIRQRPNSNPIVLNNRYDQLVWQDLDSNRLRLLNLKTAEDLLSWILSE